MDPNENDVVQGQDDAVSQPSGTDESAQQDNGNNLYSQYLENIPTDLHPVVIESYKKWDGDVTKRLQSVHSEYEPYKPVFEQYEPDALQQAVQLAEALESDPEAFLKALQEAYGITPQQQGQEFVQQQQEPEVNYGNEPLSPEAVRLDQQEQLLRAMAERMLAEEQQREEQQRFQQEEAEYEQTMTALKTQYGEFDEVYVNSLLAQGVDPHLAVNHWKQQVETFAQQRLAPNLTAPTVMGAGGGMPSVQRDVAELSSQETRHLVEQMLRQAAESGN